MNTRFRIGLISFAAVCIVFGGIVLWRFTTLTPTVAPLITSTATTNKIITSTFAGIYVITPILQNVSQQPLAESTYAGSDVTGIDLSFPWGTVEPAQDTFDWRTIDPEIRTAVSVGKKLDLVVIANGMVIPTAKSLGMNTLSAPTWLFDQDVPKITFIDGAHGGEFGCRVNIMAPPWNVTYEQAYAQMMMALAQHLHSIPGAYQAVSIVKITGINELTGETRLPAQTKSLPGAECQNITNTTPLWIQAGYTPEKVIGAWKILAEAVNAAFPDKILADEIIGTPGGFPPINNEGTTISYRDPSYVDVSAAILHEGIQLFPGRFAVQSDGIATNTYDPGVIQAHEAGAIEGWQTNTYLNGGTNVLAEPVVSGSTLDEGAGCNGLLTKAQPCTEPEYQSILDGGIATGAQYIEVWPADASGFPGAITEAQGKLQQ